MHRTIGRAVLAVALLAATVVAATPPAGATAVPAAQQNCFSGTGPAYAQWAVYKPYNFAPGTYCIHGQSWAPLRLVWQSDGNLVYYEGSSAVWSSNTFNKGATRLALQTDGNIVIYAGSRVLWASDHFACLPTGSTVFRLVVEKESSNAGQFDAMLETQASPAGVVWDYQVGHSSTGSCQT